MSLVRMDRLLGWKDGISVNNGQYAGPLSIRRVDWWCTPVLGSGEWAITVAVRRGRGQSCRCRVASGSPLKEIYDWK
ncbi:MAG: hypothetical protein ACR2N1_01655 [Rubripirellula sp.]